MALVPGGLLTLPDKVLVQIFVRLPHEEVLRNLIQVCRRFERLVDSAAEFSTRSLTKTDLSLSQENLLHRLSTNPRFLVFKVGCSSFRESNNFSGFNHANYQTIQDTLKHSMPGLKEVWLSADGPGNDFASAERIRCLSARVFPAVERRPVKIVVDGLRLQELVDLYFYMWQSNVAGFEITSPHLPNPAGFLPKIFAQMIKTGLGVGTLRIQDKFGNVAVEKEFHGDYFRLYSDLDQLEQILGLNLFNSVNLQDADSVVYERLSLLSMIIAIR